MEGYIKLHRKILEWEWYDDPNTMRLFLHILLKANYSDKNWRGIIIKRGQLLSSIGNLSKETKLSIQQVRTVLEKLKSTQEITSYTTSLYTILEVINYESYQGEITNEQQTDNKPITNEQQQHKNTKKDKNNKKEIYRAFAHLEITEEEVEKLKSEGYTTEQIDGILDEIQNFKKNTKYTSLLITARNWLKRRQTDNKTPSSNNSAYDKVELL